MAIFLVTTMFYWTAPPLQAFEKASEGKINFNRDVRPILADNCFACHGPDAAHVEADLRLDLQESAVRPDGVIVLGKPSKSELVRRINSHDADARMPPEKSHKTLTADEKSLLARWIAEGAEYQDHWAFIAPQLPEVPLIVDAEIVIRDPIDAFIAARLKQEGLAMSPEADRATLIRRLSLDLTGLPPTIAELDAYLNDESEQAYERVADRLLSSPAYAERMTVKWLDLARYADTHGYNNDGESTQWPWRDWVIHAFNTNMPYDQFIVDQLAGDLLEDATPQQRLATAFCRNHVISSEGGIIPEEYRVEYVADRVHTTATVFLGLSMQCARCHDHKFDPITQREYYSLFAFFNNVPETTLAYGGKIVAAAPAMRIPSPLLNPQLQRIDQQVAVFKRRLESRDDEIDLVLAKWAKEMESVEQAVKFPEGLLAHIALDEGQGELAHDSVDARRVGKIIGDVKWAEGKLNKSLDFNGKTHVDFGQLVELDADNPFSISAWIFPTSNSPITVVSKMDDGAAHRGFDLIIEQGRPAIHMIHHWPDNSIKKITRKPLSLNAWHHVLVSYNGSSTAAGVSIYIDGQAMAMDTVADKLRGTITTQKPVHLGRRSDSVPFQGKIDEVQFYSRCLDSEQVQQLFNAQLPVSVAEIIATATSQRTPVQQAQLRTHYLHYIDLPYRKLLGELGNLNQQRVEAEKTTAPPTMVMSEMATPRQATVLKRGDYDQPGESVSPNVPHSLPPLPDGAPTNRLGLAQWLIQPDNPLTARVAVNRWWQLYFGTGIVETVEDFGSQGTWPTHPELLDWLAIELIASNWNVKAMQKRIVMSATYRQSSHVTTALLQRDPMNQLLARGPRFRLPAEAIRDNALSVSGLLVQQLGGPSVKPYQPAGLWRDVSVSQSVIYKQDLGQNLYRRSMYTFWKRTCPPPSLSTFDAPDRETCQIRRMRTNTPLQALVLMNDPTYVEAARMLAERVMLEGGESVESKVNHAYRLVLARRCRPAEQRAMLSLLEEARARFQAETEKAIALLTTGDSTRNTKLDSIELAAWTTVTSVLLCLDETISKE
ncbi:MAG: DUF1553 domain-containing protein [Planctomycetaceae bacterium]|nr:DUF1553 domain-containing protein [Planctomycetaceae bacterium]MBT7257093.1 DUF1553 domain-containing protein [Planctomycetaceae bacterium]